MLIFSFFILSGHMFFTLSILLKKLELAIIGRVLLGIGLESYSILQNKILSQYFRGNQMTLAMTIYMGSGQIGTFLNFIITPKIAEIFSPFLACCFGNFLVLLALALSFKSFKKNESFIDQVLHASNLIDNSTAILPEIADMNVANKENNLNGEFLFNYDFQQIAASQPVLNNEIQNNVNQPKKDRFNSSFNIFVIICFLFGLGLYPFFNIAPMMYQVRFNIKHKNSSYMVSYITIISLLFSIIIAFFANKHGHVLTISIFGAFLLSLSHLSVLIADKSPLVSVFSLGLSIPMASSFTYSLNKVIPESIYHLGLSILTCVANIAYTLSPLVISFLIARDSTYRMVEIYFMSASFLVLTFLIYLAYKNKTKNLDLNSKA